MAVHVKRYLFVFLCFLLYCSTAFSQQVALSLGSASGSPGTTVNVNLTLTASGSPQPSSLQWRLTPGSGIASSVFTVAGTAVTAGKSVSCQNNGGAIECVLFGVNSATIPNGTIATLALTIAAGTTQSSAALALSAPVASSAAGTAIPATASGGTITIAQPPPPPSTFSISGSISGGAGASVALAGAAARTTTADGSGNYTFTGLANGTYSVTPTLSGYTMTPVNRSVTVNGANLTGINFAAARQTQTWTISGSISGGAGATVTLTGAASKTTTADSTGNFSFTGLVNGTYAVTPNKTGSTFTPSTRSVNVNNANVTGVSFAAATQTWGISGSISGSGNTTVSLTGPVTLTTTSDASGNYSFAGLVNGTYLVTPSKSGYSFNPANRSVTINGTNQTSINFAATAATFTISGKIQSGAGASVALTGATTRTALADGLGNYSFAGLPSGSYTVTPKLSGYTITPASRSVTLSTANAPALDFSATPLTQGSTPSIDVTVSRDYSWVTSSLTSPAFTTKSGNQLLLALVSADDARLGQSVRSVSGGNLIWKLAQRTNQQGGTAEIWYAFATQPVATTVSATLLQPATSQITVMSFANVDASGNGSGALGAIVSANSGSGAPTAAVTPTRAGSLLVGVGTDPRSSVDRVSLPGQTILHQFKLAFRGTSWVQRMDSAVAQAGVQTVFGDASPTWSAYNLTVVEVLGTQSTTLSTNDVQFPPSKGWGRQSFSDQSTVQERAPVAAQLVQSGTLEPTSVCSPGGLGTLVGANFTTKAPLFASSPLPTELNGVRVEMGGKPAPLLMVRENLIRFLCPDAEVGTLRGLEVFTENGTVLTGNSSTVVAAAPALFMLPDSEDGVVYVPERADGASDGAEGQALPVQHGELIRIYAASLGAAENAPAIGATAPVEPPSKLVSPVKVVVAGVDIQPTFAGLAPGWIGIYQVDFRLPEEVPAGRDIPLSLEVRLPDGTSVLSNLVRIAVAPSQRRRR